MIDARTEKSKDTWESPKSLVEDVRTVFDGVIDFDPFCLAKNCLGESGSPFDAGGDGFKDAWFGNVYVNSPYGRALPKVVDTIIRKVGVECEAVIQLAPARLGARWFRTAASHAQSLRVLTRRPIFTLDGQPALDKKGKPTSAQFDCCLFFYGRQGVALRRFDEVFAGKSHKWQLVK